MSVSAPVAAKANGLSTVIDTIAAPAEAFERLRQAPTWGWAVTITIVLMMLGAYIQGPTARHVAVLQTQRFMNTSTIAANMSAEQKQKAIENSGKTSPFSYIGPLVALFFAVFFNALILLAGNAAGRGQADFKRLWCGSMNIAVPTLGLGAIVLGVITVLRGPDSFSSAMSMAQAVPSLGMLAPHAPATTAAFLSAISVFTVWGFFLNATMMRVMAKTSPGIAYTFAGIVLLLGALLSAGGVALARNFGMA